MTSAPLTICSPQLGAPPGFRTIQVYPKDLQVLPGHPEPAVSWHSGFRGGAHARPKTTPVHYAARRRSSMAAHIAHEIKDLDAKQTMLQGIMFVLQ